MKIVYDGEDGENGDFVNRNEEAREKELSQIVAEGACRAVHRQECAITGKKDHNN